LSVSWSLALDSSVIQTGTLTHSPLEVSKV
jgi:hypothetical protein